MEGSGNRARRNEWAKPIKDSLFYCSIQSSDTYAIFDFILYKGLSKSRYASSKIAEEPKGASKYIMDQEQEPNSEELFPKVKRKAVENPSASNQFAQAELNLLAKLIGTDALAAIHQESSKEAIRINLFDHEEQIQEEKPDPVK